MLKLYFEHKEEFRYDSIFQVPLKIGLEKTIKYFKEELIRQHIHPII